MELAGATVDAVRGLGGRLVFVRGSARDDPERAAASADAIAGRLLHERAVGGVDPDGRLQVAVGPAGVHSDGEATFRALGEVAASTGCGGGHRRTSRWTPPSPSSGTGGGRSTCSRSGGGSHRT